MTASGDTGRLKATEKLHLIHQVKAGESVESVASRAGISPKSLYRWLRLYARASGAERFSVLRDSYSSGKRHWRKIPPEIERKILKTALEHPDWEARGIAESLGRDESGKPLVSSHGVHRVLSEHGFSRREDRETYRDKNGTSLVEKPDLRTKREMIQAVEAGEPIASVCRRFGVSRPTFYKWYRQWKEVADDKKEAALAEKIPSGHNHWRFVPEARSAVLEAIAEEPTVTLDRIVARLPKGAYGKPLLGRSGVYKFLADQGLNTLEARREWARRQMVSVVPAVSPLNGWIGRLKQVFEQFLPGRAPAPPPGVSPLLQAPFGAWLRHYKHLAPYLFFLFLVTFGLYEWGQLLGSATSTAQALGWIFASVALSMGTVFFLYSLKYYFTLAVVLSFSREAQNQSDITSDDSWQATEQSESKQTYAKDSWLSRLFGIGRAVGQSGPPTTIRASGLEPDLEQVELERKPFISIHLPMYNEKRVAERILKACTAFDYSAYEIVVVDDSTDETIGIVSTFADVWNGTRTADQPIIKVIHRETREGFKGGALKEALKHYEKS